MTDKNKYIEYLVEEYSDMIYRLALSRTKDKDTSKDVYQEVFLRLSKKTPEFENEDHEKAWIIRVTINCSNNIFENNFFKNTVPIKEELVFETEPRNEIYYAVLDLPIKYRTVIHLFYYEGYKTNEISKILNVNENTVKSQLSRARERLKSKIEGGFEDE